MVLGIFIATPIYAQSLSYAEAEQQALKSSYSTQANQALQQASQLEAEAVKGLGLPRVDLNVRAYAFHSETDVPLGSFKQKLENDLSQGLNDKLSSGIMSFHPMFWDKFRKVQTKSSMMA